jgi:hypothetical protein
MQAAADGIAAGTVESGLHHQLVTIVAGAE